MKKIVKLATPAVDDSGAVRHPEEGALTVSADLARRWKAAGSLDGEPEDEPMAEEPDSTDTKPAARGGRKEA